jgi:hypothetical protein
LKLRVQGDVYVEKMGRYVTRTHTIASLGWSHQGIQAQRLQKRARENTMIGPRIDYLGAYYIPLVV